jgi:hypothetical protein
MELAVRAKPPPISHVSPTASVTFSAENENIVVENLEFLRRVIPSDQKIEIRSDGSKEFNNETVRNFCNNNNIIHHIIPKASPWIQAFIERGF